MTTSSALDRWTHKSRTASVVLRRVVAFALVLVAPQSFAQALIWRSELSANVAPREAAVVTDLNEKLAAMNRQLRIAPQQPAAPPLKPLQDTLRGDVQVTLVPIGYLAQSQPEFSAFDSIFMFRDLVSVDRYTSSVEGRRLLESLQKSGLRGLGFVHAGMVQLVASRRLDPSRDFKGLKVAPALGSESIARQFAALGAVAVPMPFGEASVALERGAVDATETTWQELVRLPPESGVVVESNHRYRGYVLVANSAAFDRLGRSAQVQLLADAESVVENHNAKVQREEARARDVLFARRAPGVRIKGADYQVLTSLLKTGGWTSDVAQGPAMASAMAVSDPDLARKLFGGAASAVPPPRARSYAVQIPPPVQELETKGVDSGAVQPGGPGGIFGSIFAGVSSVFGRGGYSMASTASSQPLYNVDLAPQLPRDQSAPGRPVVQAGVAASLRIDIGPKRATSILPDTTPSPAILESKDDVPLTVVLACGFCEPQAESLKRMTFRPSEGTSDPVVFQFTPQRRDGGVSYMDRLQLSIVNDKTGREYDRLVVQVAIADAVVPAAATPPAATVMTIPSRGGDRSDWGADVLLYATEEMGRNITLSLEPVSDGMKKLLGPLAFDAQGARRSFRSGIDDAQLVDAMTNSAYGAMSAVSMQGDFLKKLSATGMDAAVSQSSQESLELTDAESASVSAVVAETGKRLYRHLFYSSADTDLRKLIVMLEGAAAAAPAGRPLRLRVITNRLSLPWQYLHPVGPDIDPGKFWGLQFNISVLRVNTNTGANDKTSMEQARKVVFARYGSSADPTVPLAEKQAAQLMLMPLAQDDLVSVDTGADLLLRVSSQRKQISGIVTFLHASAGSADTVPQLQFNDGDVVTSDSLENLLNKVSADEQDTRYLAGAPLVILNACETGPSRNLPHVKLENAMFQLGARGVVVTEVSVWISLGHEVATRLIARLSGGEPVSDALTAVRRELYQQKKNPLGLLYVYYGDPAATLRR